MGPKCSLYSCSFPQPISLSFGIGLSNSFIIIFANVMSLITYLLVKGWNDAMSMLKTGSNSWALYAKSVLDRTRLALTNMAEWFQQVLQPSAEYLGSSLGVDRWAVCDSY